MPVSVHTVIKVTQSLRRAGCGVLTFLKCRTTGKSWEGVNMVAYGPGKKKEIPVSPLLSVSAETPLSWGEIHLSFLHPFSEVTVAKECAYEFWEREKQPPPTPKYNPQSLHCPKT